MPFQTVRLKPGVNTNATPTLLEAGYSQSNLIRWRNGLAEKMGGWVAFINIVFSGVIRALHAWQDLNGTDRLAVGDTEGLGVVADGVFTDITPQELQSNFEPNFTTAASSATVTVVDANIGTVSIYDSVEFLTPISVGGIVLSGVYQINLALGATSYEIIAAAAATTTRRPLTITNITQANPGVVTYTGADNIANGDLVYIYGVVGMTQVNNLLFTVANLNTGSNTFELSGVNTTGYTAYVSGGIASTAAVPRFTTVSGSTSVTVKFQDHGLSVDNTINFRISTTGGGVSISGTYTVFSVTDVDNFVITLDTQASSSTSFFMNSGQARLLYYIALGPDSASSGYGIGTYGTGGYGTGVAPTQQTGTPITADDWTLDNWGELLLACPQNGGIYYWGASTGIQQAQLVATAPSINTGIFVSMPAQILVAYGSTINENIGIQQDPLLVRWSDQEDFFVWDITATTQAGSFRIPTGSMIVGGFQSRNYALLWTDIDLYGMEYVGPPFVFQFNKIAANCGLIGRHAAAQLAGNIYWIGKSKEFFSMSGNGVAPLETSVYDVIFQDLDTDNQHKCVAAPNSPFNEVLFFYPSASGNTGECDKYVKFTTTTGEWDYGNLARTAWIDVSVLGQPIGAGADGILYQHEMGYDANTAAMGASFTTGYWVIGDGEDFGYCDFIIPDFKYGTWSGAQDADLTLTFLVVDYPGDTPTEYGPYSVNASTTFINTRFRGRQMAMRVESDDVGSFWRIGAIRLRVAVDGRR